MRNMKRWKRLLAVGMCSAMVFSMSVGVSATENQDTKELTVETEENDKVEESVVETENQDINKPTGEIGIEGGETFDEVKAPVKTDKEVIKAQVEESKKPELITTEADFDGVNNVAFKVKNTVRLEGDYGADGSLVFCQIGGVGFLTVSLDWLMSYDSETEEIIVNGGALWYLMTQENRFDNVIVEVGLKGDGDTYSGVTLKINYIDKNWTENAEIPKLVDSYCEFNGTKDMEFRFENVTGANKVTSVDGIMFYLKEVNASNALSWIRMRNETGNDFGDDIENGYVKLPKADTAGFVYDEKWNAVSNIYGRVGVLVTLANGKQCMLNGDGDTDWSFKVLEKSSEATEQYWEDVPKNKEFTAEEMQTLVDKNKTADVTLRTPEGVYYTFAKSTMRMIEGKDTYIFDLELITLFKDSGINNAKVTEEDFGCRINFKNSGELPGTAKVSIPVGEKWNGKELFYYQIMEDGTLKDTGEKDVVESGRCEVSQSHCSDYVLLAKSPKELGVTENTGNGNNNTGNGNNQSGNGNTQGTSGNSNPQFQPADTTKTSPRTGDNNMILLFAVLCVGSCIVGGSTLKARRRTR